MSYKLLLLLTVLLLSANTYQNPPQPISQINGDYFVDQIGSSTINRAFTINIENPNIFISGCNQLRSTFVYDSNTQRIRFQQFSATRRGCPNDQDFLITGALERARRVAFSGQVLVFNDQRGVEILRMRPSGSSFNNQGFQPQPSFNDVQPQNSFIPQPQNNFGSPLPSTLPFTGQSTSIVGQYDLTVPAIQLNIDRNSHRFEGCNSHVINIQRSSDGGAIFRPRTSTRKQCQRDYDQHYLKAYNLGRFLQNFGTNSFRILDQNRRILLQINPAPTQGHLLSLPSVRLTVDDLGFIFEGCNINTIQYTLSQQNIQFGQSTSTLRFCLFHDYDSLLSESIRAATTYQLSNQGLVLLSNNFPTIIAIIRIANNQGFNPSPLPIVTLPQIPTYPVVRPTPIFPTTPVYDFSVPTISLPGVSPVSLKGTYTFNAQSSQLSAIIIKFDEEYLEFEGCNIHRLPYAAYSDGVFCLLQGGSSTQRQCTLDQDAGILNFIRSINRFSRSEDGFNFFVYQSLIATISTKVRNEIVRYNVINGGYRLEIPGIEVTVSQNTISFQGCNSVSIPFTLYRDGRISFGNAITTYASCNRDTDQYYTQSIIRSVSIRQSADGYILYDQTGAQTIRFVSYLGTQYQNFNGRYRMQLPGTGIRLKVSDGVFTLSGCNQFNFKFTLSDNGNIIFGAVTSTKVKCQNDIDNAFLYTLLRAQSIAVVGNSIVFKNGNGVQIAKANNFDLNDNQSPPIYIDPKSPVVPLRQFQFNQGTYRVNLLRSNIKALAGTVTRGVLTVTGCNTHTFTINAYSNGNVTFTLTGSTKRACQQNYDKFFLEAFQQILKYDAMKGMYTLFDDKRSLLQLTSVSNNFDFSGPQVIDDTRPPGIVGPESFISLRGRYRFQIPQVGLQIINGSFVFKGRCHHRIPCTYKNTNIFFGNPISSSNCPGIRDDKYFLNLIPQISTFRRQDRSLTFFNSRLQSLFNAGVFSLPSKSVDVLPGLTSGSYEANFPTVDVQFDDKNIFFNKCKRSGLGYRASNQGTFSFSGDVRPCSNEYFDSFRNAFEGSSRYSQIDNGFILQDDSGNQRGRCIKY